MLSPRPRRTRRLPSRAARSALALGLGLTLTLPALTGSAQAGAPQVTDAGTWGIGDPMYPLDGNGGIDVEHYRINQRLDLGRGIVRGSTALTLTTTRQLSRFNLDFLLGVSKVTVNGSAARFTRRAGHELLITPAEPLASGARAKVTVSYRGRPGTKRYGFQVGQLTNFVANRRTMMAVSEPHSASYWYPVNEHPRDVATYDVTTNVRTGLQVVGNGSLVKRVTHGARTTWRWRSSDAMQSYLSFFVAGRFRLEKSHDLSGRPTWYAVSKDLEPAVQRRAMRALKRTPAHTRRLEKLIGRPYPWATNGGVVVGLQTGFALETQGRPVYSWWGQIPLTHELAHQWFGNDVRFDRWSDLWLSEGFASFLDAWASAPGGDTRTDLLNEWRWYGRSSKVWRPIAPLSRKNLFGEAVYLRGSMTLAALRNRVGDATFRRIIGTWYDEQRGSTARTHEFEALAARISGENLDGFFDAWLRAPRRPARTAENGLTQGG